MYELSTELVLAQEALAIDPDIDDAALRFAAQRQNASSGGTGATRLGLTGSDADAARCEASADRQQALYQALNKLERTALCLSGGGIRSAAFSLGVIQALATHPRPRPLRKTLKDETYPAQQEAGTAPAAGDENATKNDGNVAMRGADSPQENLGNIVGRAADSLLGKCHYLSTVSGGGYIGGWLSACIRRTDFHTVWQNLVDRPCGPDNEPGSVSWLRAYSNYLTPKLGVLSADSWAAAAISLRNLILNWLMILPLICLVLLGLKLLTVASVAIAHMMDNCALVTLFVLGPAVVLLVVSLRFTTRHRPTRARGEEVDTDPRFHGVRQWQFLVYDLACAYAAAILLTLWLSSNCGLEVVARHATLTVVGLGAAAGFVVYGFSWIIARPAFDARDLFRWSVSGAVYGALVGTGAFLYAQAPQDGFYLFNDLLLPLLFGVPWILVSQMIAEMIFVGLTSYQPNSDTDREWLGRAAGWLLVTTLGWVLVTFLTFAGSLMVTNLASQVSTWIAPLGGISGIVTAWLGKSRLTPAKGDPQGAMAVSIQLILVIAATLFAVVLIITLSAALDTILFDDSLVLLLRRLRMSYVMIALWLVLGIVVVGSVGVVAWHNVNVNRFSLHALYRNRLIRAFLGASQPARKPDAFTGFAPEDNLPVHELWPKIPASGRDGRGWRPFHIINMALNIVSTRQLAWQERKAEPFTVSPLHAGSPCKAFRPSSEYGDPAKGITLGTAVAISGAAASPNMGYNSSPAVSFLMALLNVRLGWWLGNPGREGEQTYRNECPRWAIGPLLMETFGLTTDDRPYVYLSDGGHFENLGIYEMVRRRCRFIIAVDAGADPNHTFQDLGNAVRKIKLDLGVTVRFRGLSALKKRPLEGPEIGPGQPYHAVGEIDYPAADHGGERGVILYIKPGYHGEEDAGVRSYAIAHRAFPHESTGDQFFSESQFESYRALGFEIADQLLSRVLDRLRYPRTVGIREISAELVRMSDEDAGARSATG